MSRSEVEHQYMIDGGADLVYMRGLVNALDTFQRIKRSLKRWQTQEFPMKEYFTGILIYITYNQLGPVIGRFGKLSSLNGAQKV
jgi:hypothetical protein